MARLQADTNIASFTVTVSGSGGTTNQAQINVTLKPLGERPPADQMVSELTRRTAGIPGLQVFFQNPPSIRIGGRSTKTLYQYNVRGSDIAQLYTEAGRLLARLQEEPMLSGVTSDLLNRSPILRVHIDRDRALKLGVSPATIENALANAYNQQQVSTIYTPTNEYWVVMETVPGAQLDAHALEHFFVPTGGGKMIPLTAVADFEHVFGPLSIAHSGRMASVTISFNLATGVSLGVAVDRVNEVARRTLPATLTTGFAGTAQAFQASQQGLGILLVITVFLIYMILGILYESFIHPITILSGLPFAAFGALFALYVTHSELGVYGYVGIIMLVGIVKKNAIMMIDFAVAEERTSGEGPAAAIVKAAGVRFRPIMMTTVSAIAGTLPIAIGVGASAASRRPLGIVVVGGLVFSQVVTLYVTPVFYTYLDELQTWGGAALSRLRTAVVARRPRSRGRAGTGAPALAVTGAPRSPTHLTTLFIRRPVMTSLVMIAILVFGIAACRLLPVSDLPNVDFPTITVTASMPGSSPETMAATVATPLEKWFSDIPGIDNMTSTSSLGETQLVVQFALDRDIDAAAQDIQAAIARSAPSAPEGDGCALVPEGQPGGRADPDARAHVAFGAALDARRIRRDDDRAAPLDGHGRRTGVRVRHAEVRGAAADGPDRARDARDRARGRRRPPCPAQNVNLPDRRAVGTEQVASRCTRPGNWTARARSSTSSSRTGTARRCTSASWGASRTTSRTTRPRAGTTASPRSSWRSGGSPAPTPCRSRNASRTRWRSFAR